MQSYSPHEKLFKLNKFETAHDCVKCTQNVDPEYICASHVHYTQFKYIYIYIYTSHSPLSSALAPSHPRAPPKWSAIIVSRYVISSFPINVLCLRMGCAQFFLFLRNTDDLYDYLLYWRSPQYEPSTLTASKTPVLTTPGHSSYSKQSQNRYLSFSSRLF